ncbi:TraQ conjugal transfer family protein [Pedobacter alluvionis]|uniref:DUF3872 domain-containing protein n=1 Tax=Pedobacter alluvionis TaxID=475253 RepID=A0A497Y0J8_9SPHI|nr:TraQ conjugal transfer family protein [Pedobacter alluvionis]RLJ75115.1 uncharacterized protein DUF3872 [Pedobacter alluvionis]TFB30219.1 DUF3872 domain-containing protein [Pedobacter alluvionis]
MKNLSIKNQFVEGRMKIVLSLVTVMALLFTIMSCNDELDVKTNFPFEVEVMPVPKSIAVGETVPIKCTIKAGGNYSGTQYYMRYFPVDGKGRVFIGIAGKAVTLKPNESYLLPGKVFTVYYGSEVNATHTIDLWIFDNNGNEQKMTFQFNPKQKS